MIKVYHANKPSFGLSEIIDVPESKWPEDYTLVATVDVAELDVAFHLTNNIDESWTKNDKVETEFAECRSTSVGDVLESNGKFYRAEMFGWSKLIDDEWKNISSNRWRVALELTWDKSPKDVEVRSPGDAGPDFARRGFERLKPHLDSLIKEGIVAHYHVLEPTDECVELD